MLDLTERRGEHLSAFRSPSTDRELQKIGVRDLAEPRGEHSSAFSSPSGPSKK